MDVSRSSRIEHFTRSSAGDDSATWRYVRGRGMGPSILREAITTDQECPRPSPVLSARRGEHTKKSQPGTLSPTLAEPEEFRPRAGRSRSSADPPVVPARQVAVQQFL